MQASRQANANQATKPRYKIPSPTIYASLTPEQALRTYRRRRLRMFGLLILICVVMLAAFDVVAPSSTQGQQLAFVVVMLAIIVAIEVRIIMRDTIQILGILNGDCDPAKLLAIADLMGKKGGLAGALLNPKQLRGDYLRMVCLIDLDRIDEARALLPTIKLGSNIAGRVARHDVSLAFARHDGDLDAIRREHAMLSELISSGKVGKNVLAQATWCKVGAEFALAMGEKDYRSAHAALSNLRGLSWCRMCELVCHHHAAQLAEAEGNPATARANYQLVANTSGTMAIIDEARAWLAEQAGQRLES